jgi:hypothetical protein
MPLPFCNELNLQENTKYIVLYKEDLIRKAEWHPFQGALDLRSEVNQQVMDIRESLQDPGGMVLEGKVLNGLFWPTSSAVQSPLVTPLAEDVIADQGSDVIAARSNGQIIKVELRNWAGFGLSAQAATKTAKADEQLSQFHKLGEVLYGTIKGRYLVEDHQCE